MVHSSIRQRASPTALVEYQKRRGPFQPEAERGNLTDRVWSTKQVAQTADYTAEPVNEYGISPIRLANIQF